MPVPAEIKVAAPSATTYDDVRCGTCGRPWEGHAADCPRHAYRPGVRIKGVGDYSQIEAERRGLAPGPGLPDVVTAGALAGHLIELERLAPRRQAAEEARLEGPDRTEDPKGGDIAEVPHGLRVRRFPEVQPA